PVHFLFCNGRASDKCEPDALFLVGDNTNGIELWRSDGTTDGTTLVKDINPGPADSQPYNFVDVNGTLFFTATDGAPGVELWKSNGTAAGTMLVRNINPDGDSYVDFSSTLVNVNGTLFFSASDGAAGVELWKSDGTPDGTTLVKDVNP